MQVHVDAGGIVPVNEKSQPINVIRDPIGKVKLSRIAPQFLLSFYKKLLNGDAGKRKYEAKPDLLKYMKSQKITRVSVSEGSELAIGTVSKAVKCIRIYDLLCVLFPIHFRLQILKNV